MKDKCGTLAGYKRHRYIKEKVCPSCILAENSYQKSRYQRKIRKTSKCGTYSGYQKHLRLKEETCNICKLAYNEYNRGYYSRNPEKTSIKNNKRRALKFQNGHEDYTEEQVLEIYGTNCHLCLEPIDLTAPRKVGLLGWEQGLHIEHLIPLSKDGTDTIENVRPSHGKCNLIKGSKFLYEPQPKCGPLPQV